MKQRRAIRSIIIRAVIFLLLVTGGAIVNIAVAWGCAAWINGPIRWQPGNFIGPTRTESAVTSGHDDTLPFQGEQFLERILQPGVHRLQSSWSPNFSASSFTTAEFPDLVPTWAPWLALSADEIDATYGMRVADARGWPWPALWYRADWDAASMWPAKGAPQYAWGLPLAPRKAAWSAGFWDRALPLAPIWPSFLVNSVLYAVILWLFFAARLALPQHRRMRRIKRGLCPACAYPIGASNLCTECGMPVIRRAQLGSAKEATDQGEANPSI